MKLSNGVTVNIECCEILFHSPEIIIKSQEKLHPEYIKSGITVQGQKGSVMLSGDKRTATWKPEEKVTPGNYTLIIDELVTENGRKFTIKATIPFFITQSKAAVPKNMKVESMIRLKINKLSTERVHDTLPVKGKFIEVMKGTDRKNGKPVELGFDERGKKINHNAIFNKIMSNRMRKYGKIHPTLYEAFSKNPKSRQPVAIWTNENEEAIFIDKLRLKPSSIPKESKSIKEENEKSGENMATFMRDKYPYIKIKRDPAAPVFYTYLNKTECLSMAKSKEFGRFFLYEEKGYTDLSDSMAIAHSDDVQAAGFTGKGIRVSVWEDGPDSTANLVIQEFFDPVRINTSDHARHTHGIIKNKEQGKPHGHASGCTLYSANTNSLSALRWAVQDRNCTVISQSFHRDSEQTSGDLSFDDIYKDWLVVNFPYPTILQAAGNGSSTEFVNHKGYNSLTVGNHNDAASAMASDSVFRNPSATHGDRELPEICANGTAVTTVGLTKSGTSMAAPAVAGCTALLQEANNILTIWPEGCRAILLAGATRNVKGDTWWNDLRSNADGSDGTGAVNALQSINIVRAGRSRRNTAGTQKGWDVGQLSPGDFDANNLSTFYYGIKVPAGALRPRSVKVALAWDSKITTFLNILPLGSRLTLDFDLKIFDSNGNLVGYSGSWDNSYEIAEFTGTPGETYKIKITKWSGNDKTWFGIAWTITGGALVVWPPSSTE